MSYRSDYGTDWTRLTREEAIERGYALGVAAELGEGLPAEYQRVLDEMDTMYQRSLVELAYDEGKKEAAQLTGGDETQEDVWDEAVRGEEPDIGTDGEPRGVPAAVAQIQMLDPPGDGLDRIRLPGFLRR